MQPWSGHAVNYYFVGSLLLCAAYAFIAGGGPERIGAAAYTLSVAATHLILWSHSSEYDAVEFGVLIVDVLIFIIFTILAVRANRYWPIWVSALLGLGVLGHLARWVGPDVIPWAYAVILTIWSYPILAIMALGTFNHQQRLKQFGTDPPWSSGSAGSEPPPGPTM